VTLIEPCIRCGYCCSKSPCPYGERVPCAHLAWKDGGEATCLIWDEIVADSDSWGSPAPGAGCSSTLFNDWRRERQLSLEMAKKYRI
jgi:hypothetical protein